MTKILASVVSCAGSAPGAKVNGYHVAEKLEQFELLKMVVIIVRNTEELLWVCSS